MIKFQTHIVCTTPKFRATNLEDDVEVYLVVSSGPGKTSEQYGHPMYYYMSACAGKLTGSWMPSFIYYFKIMEIHARLINKCKQLILQAGFGKSTKIAFEIIKQFCPLF